MNSQTSQELISSSNAKPNVLQCNPGYHWDYYWKKCMPDCPAGYHNDSITGACVLNGGNPHINISYAGVNISYYTTNHILNFNSSSDVNTVLNQLDSDYEHYNTTYENKYPGYTSDQLDSLDSVNNFDQLKTFRDFEAKFPNYTSERLIIENTETNWLNNNFTGIDPDSVDLSIDNSENSICNNNYEVMIAGSLYQWTSSGLIITGGNNANSPNSISPCFRNQKAIAGFSTSNRSFRVKAAINYSVVRSSGKGKVVSFKLKGNKWKRARYDLEVAIYGNIYAEDCASIVQTNVANPTSGYKKRRELKVAVRAYATIYQGRSNEFGSSFLTPIAQGSVLIH